MILLCSKELLKYESSYKAAVVRTVISRAYYSSFLVAREELKNQLPIPSLYELFSETLWKPEIHQVVYDLIKILDPVTADFLGN